jgi:hypothetical protein
MGKSLALIGSVAVVLLMAISAIAGPSANAASPAPVALGDAGRFAVLASAALTNSTGATVINGNAGWGTAISGFTGAPLGTVTGTTYGPTPAWQLAHDDLVSAYSEASTRLGATAAPANDLGGKTLTAGFYDSIAAGALAMTTDLTLDGENDPNAIFIIRTAAALNTTATVHVNLTRGARACNVYWVVGAATTLGANTTFKGNIISRQAITLGAGSTVDGRAFSVTADVTLDANTITWCDTTTPTITAPPTVHVATAPGDTSCSAFVSDATLGTASASDNSGGLVTITRGPVPAGNLFPLGTTGVVYTARDPSDNTASATQAVIVTDGTPPVITGVPANTSYQFAGDVPAANPNSVTATDNCGAVTKSVADTSNGGAGTPASPLIITRTFTATDTANNITTAAQIITVADNTPPTITAPPTKTASTGPGALGCGTTISDAALGSAAASDNSGSVVVTRSPTFNNFPVGDTTLTYTATDPAGNTASATQLVTVTDNTPPVITGVPVDATYQLVSNVPLANATSVTATDNCGATRSVLDTDNGGSGTAASHLIITRTFTAADAAGSSVTAVQTITVFDNTAPTITPPLGVIAFTGPGAATCSVVISNAALGTATASDSSGGTPTITRAPAGNTFAVGVTTLTYTATDAAGNTASAAQLVTVNDNTPPVITGVPIDASYQFLSGVPAANANSVTATDNCGAATKSVLDTNNGGAGTPASHLIITRTFTATDAAGNATSSAQTITVIDNTAPTITAPPDKIAFTGPGAPGCSVTISDTVLGSATASDNSGSVVVTRSPTSNSFPVGATTLTYTATDPAGNTASATQLVTVTDNTPPTIASVPIDATYQLLSDVPGGNANNATASDNCGAPTKSVIDTDNGGLGTAASHLIITRTFRATDAAGNSVTAVQTITVVDNTAPTIAPPPGVSVFTGPGAATCSAFVSNATLGTATGSDSSGGPVTISRVPAGNTFAVGVTTIIYTATDAASNSASAPQDVSVSDNTAPALSGVPASASYQLVSAVPAANANSVTATDNCGTPVRSVVDTHNGGAGSAASPLVITRTFTATDAAGNATSSAQIITVIDSIAPTIAAPANASAFTGAGALTCNAVVSDAALGPAIASDNSGVATVTRLPAGNTFALGTTTITYTATDPAGNTASATQVVTVADNTVPTFTSVPANATYQLLTAVPTANPNDAISADNCSVPTRSVVDTDNGGAGTALSPLIITRTFTATDASSNVATAVQTIGVGDTTPPTISAPSNRTALTGPGALACAATVSDAALGAASASDNSGTVIVGRSPAFNSFPVGITTLTYTATDPAGNMATATQLVTVSDNTVPTITSIPANATYQLLSDVPVATASNAVATDNCAAPTTSVVDTDNGGLGTAASPLIITRTFTATDAASNSASAAQTITVNAAAATPAPTPTPTPTVAPTPLPTPGSTTPPTAPPFTPSAAPTNVPAGPTSTPAVTPAPTVAGEIVPPGALPSTSTVDRSGVAVVGLVLTLLGGLLLARSRYRA